MLIETYANYTFATMGGRACPIRYDGCNQRARVLIINNRTLIDRAESHGEFFFKEGLCFEFEFQDYSVIMT